MCKKEHLTGKMKGKKLLSTKASSIDSHKLEKDKCASNNPNLNIFSSYLPSLTP